MCLFVEMSSMRRVRSTEGVETDGLTIKFIFNPGTQTSVSFIINNGAKSRRVIQLNIYQNQWNIRENLYGKIKCPEYKCLIK